MSRRLTRRMFLNGAGVAIWGGSKYPVHDGTHAVLKECASLISKPPKPL